MILVFSQGRSTIIHRFAPRMSRSSTMASSWNEVDENVYKGALGPSRTLYSRQEHHVLFLTEPYIDMGLTVLSRPPGPQANSSVFKHAWKRLHFQLSKIATRIEEDCKFYQVSSQEALEKWLAATSQTADYTSMDEGTFIELKHLRFVEMYHFLQKSASSIHSSHWRFNSDGHVLDKRCCNRELRRWRRSLEDRKHVDYVFALTRSLKPQMRARKRLKSCQKHV